MNTIPFPLSIPIWCEDSVGERVWL